MTLSGLSILIAAALVCAGTVPALAASGDRELTAAGAHIHLEVAGAQVEAGNQVLEEWVQRAATIVGAYYGRFPVSALTLRIEVRDGHGVQGGKTFANPAAYIRVGLGRGVTAPELTADWVLVHEMTHLALPDTGEAHAWLSEGIATYVEGIARVQAGNRTEADVWAEELRSMPRGLPQADDQGMDHTHTWGRTYWGGAMFCLLADVQIREKTGNRFGLQDALRAVLAQSGGLSADWPIEKVLRTGDAATGTHVLAELYASYKDKPVAPDLAGLWRQLGVEPAGNSVTLTDDAPLAQVRHAIMRAPGK